MTKISVINAPLRFSCKCVPIEHLQLLLWRLELKHERVTELGQVGLAAESSQSVCHSEVRRPDQGAALSPSHQPQRGVHPAQHLTQIS